MDRTNAREGYAILWYGDNTDHRRNTNNPTGYHLPALTVDYTGYVSIGTISQPAHLYITDLNTSGTDPLLNVVTNQSTQSLFIKSDGKVGIGNNTPSQALQVTGTTVTTKLQITDAPIDGFILKSDGSGNATWSDPGTLSSSLWAASGTEIYNTNTGNVRVNDKDIMLHGSSDVNHGLGWYGTGKLWNGAAIDGPVLYGFSGGALGTTNGGQKAVLHWTSDGKVVIGTTKPTNTYTDWELSVDGNIIAKKMITETSDWADKVFSPSYHLQPLAEVEDYIRQNNHLPEVPSECDAIEKGVDIGEMNKLLLQKVEELTLHVIRQQKEIDALKTK